MSKSLFLTLLIFVFFFSSLAAAADSSSSSSSSSPPPPPLLLFGRHEGRWWTNDATNRVFNAERGEIRLRSTHNLTSKLASVDITLVLGDSLNAGRVRDITVFGGNVDGSSLVALGRGFRGYWDRERGSASSEDLTVRSSSSASIPVAAASLTDEFVRLVNFTIRSGRKSVAALEDDGGELSFRRLVDPLVWSEQEEEDYYSTCTWLLTLDLSTQGEDDNENSSFFGVLVSFLHAFQFVGDAPQTVRAATSVRGRLAGICNRSTAGFITLDVALDATRGRFHERALKSHGFALLLLVSSLFQAFGVHAVDTATRRSARALRGLSFAGLLWIVSFDVMQIGVLLIFPEVAPFSVKLVYLSLVVRCTTWHLCGIRLLVRVRNQQIELPELASTRWMLADLSAWRYMALLMTFIGTLFILNERILDPPFIFVFSLVHLPQIYQNRFEEPPPPGLPLVRFSICVSASISIPIVFATCLFDFRPRYASGALFVASLFVQTFLIHRQCESAAADFLLRRSKIAVRDYSKSAACAICLAALEDDGSRQSTPCPSPSPSSLLNQLLVEGERTPSMTNRRREKGEVWRTPCCRMLMHKACGSVWFDIRGEICPSCRVKIKF